MTHSLEKIIIKNHDLVDNKHKMENFESPKLKDNLLNLVNSFHIKQNQVEIAIFLWFTQDDIVNKTIWIKHLTELIDNPLSPNPFISIEDLRAIVLENNRDLYKIKKKLNSIIDIDSLSLEWKVLIMSILDVRW